VLRELALVPYSRVDTYGHLAARVGRPKAARAVGTVMNRNPLAIVLPCHRIVGANGSLTGYAGGLDVAGAALEARAACERRRKARCPPAGPRGRRQRRVRAQAAAVPVRRRQPSLRPGPTGGT
jgi:O-6-methylguanine DNA methyltransferase